MKVMTFEEISENSISELGLDPNVFNLNSPEVVASALRRAASFLCPCSHKELVNAVLNPLKGLLIDFDQHREVVQSTLDDLITYGDILELESQLDEALNEEYTLLYTAAPSFIARESGNIFIVGIAPDNISPLPEILQRDITFQGAIRVLRNKQNNAFPLQLETLGLDTISEEDWANCPKKISPNELIERYNSKLRGKPEINEIHGLKIINKGKAKVTYIRRWAEPTIQTGIFVGRRPRKYGADLWCFVELELGQPKRLLDLPLKTDQFRGCDIAWRLQAALDAKNKKPQVYSIVNNQGKDQVLNVYSPLPSWIRRRWELIGTRVPEFNSLLSYSFAENEISEEETFVKEFMWLKRESKF